MTNHPQNTPYLDVRTLLFCKITPAPDIGSGPDTQVHDSIYADIRKAGQKEKPDSPPAQPPQTFLTFGGYDAISVYPTDLGSNLDEWLHAVYQDKQHVIHLPSDRIIYHQMHLVSQHRDTQKIWEVEDQDYPFFLTTLVYGVSVPTGRTEPLAATPGETVCSFYEDIIRRSLKERLKQQPADIQYAVYNGITVSDVVILWRARDLLEAMDIIAYLEYSGTARKTLTTLGFPVDENGGVRRCVTDALIHAPDKTINVSIHGAIRDVTKFLNVRSLLSDVRPECNTAEIEQTVQTLAGRAYTDLQERSRLERLLQACPPDRSLDQIANASSSPDDFCAALRPQLNTVIENLSCAIPKRSWSQSLGKNDFTVSAQVSYANLANLLEIYRSYHSQFHQACWEILTDVRKEHPSADPGWFQASQVPSPILCKLYNDYQALYAANKKTPLNLAQFSWFDALQELLGTHQYIDYHPVLHDPAYLVYASLKIAYAYFAGQVTDFQSQDKRLQLLKRSEENLIHFVRNLDQLTEQLSRNDDAMLNNRSNTHTIHFSLPESALEFYHAFLRRIVDFLVKYDEKAGRVPAGFEYGFLLSPKPCSRFQLRPMLRTLHCDHDPNCDQIWPQKQAYILELPLESIFKPMDLFIPMVHECFHSFGDVLRQRDLRRQYMSLYIATCLLSATGRDSREYRQLLRGLTLLIHDQPEKSASSYLSTTWQQLCDNTYRILESDDLDEQLYEKYSVDKMLLRNWNTGKMRFFSNDPQKPLSAPRNILADSILDTCKYYFKEGYADAMTIALLRLTPSEFLNRTRDEIRRYHDLRRPDYNPADTAEQIHRDFRALAQRYAIVLAACCRQNSKFGTFSLEACKAAINDYKQPLTPLEAGAKEGFSEFSEIMRDCFDALSNSSTSLPRRYCPHPPAALIHVVDYLSSSIEKLYEGPGAQTGNNAAIDALARDFNDIIRCGNMFGQRFYQLIYEHHDSVRQELGLGNHADSV